MALKKLPVPRVTVGSVLGEDVCVRGSKQVLLSRGTQIDKSHIETMRRQGVEIITVEVPDADEAAPPAAKSTPDPVRLKELVLEQHRWFGDTREDAIMAELFRCMVARAIRRES